MSAFQLGLGYHLNARQQSAPLLLQFLLSEFIHVFHQFRSIETLIGEEQFGHSLHSLLLKLSGSPPRQKKSFQWNPDHGSASKLNFYATFFLDEVKPLGIEFLQLEKSCKESRALGIALLDVIEGQKIGEIAPAVKKLRRCVGQIAKELVKAIALFKENENVLYFLLRHKAQLDGIYESNFTVKLLKHLFLNDLQKVKDLLVRKYSSRGFGCLAKKIQQHFDDE